MRCTDYGKVNVRIRRGQRKRILLEYEPWDDEESTVWYCILNARDGYTMRSKPMQDYTEFVGAKACSLSFAEAQDWLNRYCAYHRMNPEDFRIVMRFSKRLTL